MIVFDVIKDRKIYKYIQSKWQTLKYELGTKTGYIYTAVQKFGVFLFSEFCNLYNKLFSENALIKIEKPFIMLKMFTI